MYGIPRLLHTDLLTNICMALWLPARAIQKGIASTTPSYTVQLHCIFVAFIQRTFASNYLLATELVMVPFATVPTRLFNGSSSPRKSSTAMGRPRTRMLIRTSSWYLAVSAPPHRSPRITFPRGVCARFSLPTSRYRL